MLTASNGLLSRSASVKLVYLATFFYSLHFAVTLYVESSYLETFFPEDMLGVFYTVASFLAIAVTVNMPRFLSNFGNYRTVLLLILLEMTALFGLSLATMGWLAVTLFIIHQALLAALFNSVNVFLESFSVDASTGRTRGVFLTILNAAILAGPLTASFFFSGGNFSAVFLLAALFLVPLFLFIAVKFRHYRDPSYARFPFLATLAEVLDDGDVRRISFGRFILELFYSVMVIYTPIYLNRELGIPFSAILGIIMPIALSPFVFGPYLLGRLADTRLGEKEMLIGGFALISASTAALSFVESSSVGLWALLLFITRVGATLIETMADIFFYKQVNATQANLIAFYDTLRPLAFMIGPLLATAFLALIDLKFIFLAVGLSMLVGFRYAFTITDTR